MTGVIIGRFQVPQLTIGHKALIVKAYEYFNHVGFLLGCGLPGEADPLPFESRKQMLEEWDPAFIAPIQDIPGDDKAWSKSVDEAILGQKDAIVDITNVTLIGGRQCFIPHYTGQFPCLEIPIWVGRSGTQVREAVSKQVVDSSDFRKGIIWAVHNYGL